MLDPDTASMIDECMRYLHSSGLCEEAKDYLSAQLGMVRKAANGEPDKIQALCMLMVVSKIDQIKERVREPERMAAVAAAAVAKCAEVRCKATTPTVTVPGMPGVILAWATALRPVAWPLAVAVSAAVTSANFPALVQLIQGWK
jgi:ribosomal protein L12E/L44/L45/RPP1/RPP2